MNIRNLGSGPDKNQGEDGWKQVGVPARVNEHRSIAWFKEIRGNNFDVRKKPQINSNFNEILFFAIRGPASGDGNN